MDIKRILFPTDFSEGALAALSCAVDMAKSHGAKLIMLHVIYDIVATSGLHVPHISTEEMDKELDVSARKELDKFGWEARKSLKDVQYDVIKGIPYEEILRYAEEKNIDLIVIGTHGRKGLDKFLFGSTAERVVRNAPCPVLTVRKLHK